MNNADGFSVGGFTAGTPQPRGGWLRRLTQRPRPRPRAAKRWTPPAAAPQQPARPMYASILANTEILYGEELRPGMIIIAHCHGNYCLRGTTHQRGSAHELVVTHLRRDSRSASGIAIDEDRNQHGIYYADRDTVRVKTS